jgi:hypothetical protein
MADEEEVDYARKQHQLYLDERKQLVDAARESSRTFDKAVLTFGAAVFGASIAFLKDIAPHPAPDTLKWLGAAWLFFSLGLLSILLSFLFSHRACLFEGAGPCQGRLRAAPSASQATPKSAAGISEKVSIDE